MATTITSRVFQVPKGVLVMVANVFPAAYCTETVALRIVRSRNFSGLLFNLLIYLVPGAGLEPAWDRPEGF